MAYDCFQIKAIQKYMVFSLLLHNDNYSANAGKLLLYVWKIKFRNIC